MSFFKYLFINSNQLFEEIEESDYLIIRISILGLLSLKLGIDTFILEGDIGLMIVATILSLIILYLLFIHIFPLLLKVISNWIGGHASKIELRDVLFVSMIPICLGFILSNLSQQIEAYSRTSDVANFIMFCISLKILILGVAKSNKFSVKEAAMVLITFGAFYNILGYILK